MRRRCRNVRARGRPRCGLGVDLWPRRRGHTHDQFPPKSRHHIYSHASPCSSPFELARRERRRGRFVFFIHLPELRFGAGVVQGPELHAVDLRLRLGIRGHVAADDVILVVLFRGRGGWGQRPVTGLGVNIFFAGRNEKRAKADVSGDGTTCAIRGRKVARIVAHGFPYGVGRCTAVVTAPTTPHGPHSTHSSVEP